MILVVITVLLILNATKGGAKVKIYFRIEVLTVTGNPMALT